MRLYCGKEANAYSTDTAMRHLRSNASNGEGIDIIVRLAIVVSVGFKARNETNAVS